MTAGLLTSSLVCTQNSGIAKLYLDGGLVQSAPYGANNAENTLDLFIGKAHAIPAAPAEDLFYGTLDDIRIYERALMESEISYLYRLESGGLPHLTMSVRSVELTILGVPGRRYQLESSLNAKSWTNVGQPFVATEAEISEEFDVLETGRYFKIVEAPVQP